MITLQKGFANEFYSLYLSSQEFDILRWCYMLIFGYMFLLVMVFVVIVTGTGIWVSQVPVETWYNEQLEIVGGDGNTIEQKRLVMLWNCLL